MDTLARLTEEAKQAASMYDTLERQTVEARREQVLIYGRDLLEIRKQLKNTQAFGQHLVDHQLDVRDKMWRSNAMWLAEHEGELAKKLTLCLHANPTNIRTWLRSQDPNYQPKKRSTTAGVSKPTLNVRDHIRPMVESDEPINVTDVVKETGHSRIVVEAAIAAERGRLEGLEEAPIDVFAVADAMGLSATAKAKLAALEAKLRKQHEAEYHTAVSLSVRKHIDEYVLPEYNRMLTEADERLASYKPPLSFPEYNTLLWALHEDQTDPSRRAEAFELVMRLRTVLRGADKEELKPRTLPTSLAELLTRRRKAA